MFLHAIYKCREYLTSAFDLLLVKNQLNTDLK